MTTAKNSSSAKRNPRKTAAAKSRNKKAAAKGKKTPGKRKWSAAVTGHSDALDLKKGVFTSDDPQKIARSLEKSAEESHRKKGSSRQSAASMLNFYINRAGKNLPASKKKTLNKAKEELKEISSKKEKTDKKKSANEKSARPKKTKKA